MTAIEQMAAVDAMDVSHDEIGTSDTGFQTTASSSNNSNAVLGNIKGLVSYESDSEIHSTGTPDCVQGIISSIKAGNVPDTSLTETESESMDVGSENSDQKDQCDTASGLSSDTIKAGLAKISGNVSKERLDVKVDENLNETPVMEICKSPEQEVAAAEKREINNNYITKDLCELRDGDFRSDATVFVSLRPRPNREKSPASHPPVVCGDKPVDPEQSGDTRKVSIRSCQVRLKRIDLASLTSDVEASTEERDINGNSTAQPINLAEIVAANMAKLGNCPDSMAPPVEDLSDGEISDDVTLHCVKENKHPQESRQDSLEDAADAAATTMDVSVVIGSSSDSADYHEDTEPVVVLNESDTKGSSDMVASRDDIDDSSSELIPQCEKEVIGSAEKAGDPSACREMRDDQSEVISSQADTETEISTVGESESIRSTVPDSETLGSKDSERSEDSSQNSDESEAESATVEPMVVASKTSDAQSDISSDLSFYDGKSGRTPSKDRATDMTHCAVGSFTSHQGDTSSMDSVVSLKPYEQETAKFDGPRNDGERIEKKDLEPEVGNFETSVTDPVTPTAPCVSSIGGEETPSEMTNESEDVNTHEDQNPAPQNGNDHGLARGKSVDEGNASERSDMCGDSTVSRCHQPTSRPEAGRADEMMEVDAQVATTVCSSDEMQTREGVSTDDPFLAHAGKGVGESVGQSGEGEAKPALAPERDIQSFSTSTIPAPDNAVCDKDDQSRLDIPDSNDPDGSYGIAPRENVPLLSEITETVRVSTQDNQIPDSQTCLPKTEQESEIVSAPHTEVDGELEGPVNSKDCELDPREVSDEPSNEDTCVGIENAVNINPNHDGIEVNQDSDGGENEEGDNGQNQDGKNQDQYSCNQDEQDANQREDENEESEDAANMGEVQENEGVDDDDDDENEFSEDDDDGDSNDEADNGEEAEPSKSSVAEEGPDQDDLEATVDDIEDIDGRIETKNFIRETVIENGGAHFQEPDSEDSFGDAAFSSAEEGSDDVNFRASRARGKKRDAAPSSDENEDSDDVNFRASRKRKLAAQIMSLDSEDEEDDGEGDVQYTDAGLLVEQYTEDDDSYTDEDASDTLDRARPPSAGTMELIQMVAGEGEDSDEDSWEDDDYVVDLEDGDELDSEEEAEIDEMTDGFVIDEAEEASEDDRDSCESSDSIRIRREERRLADAGLLELPDYEKHNYLDITPPQVYRQRGVKRRAPSQWTAPSPKLRKPNPRNSSEVREARRRLDRFLSAHRTKVQKRSQQTPRIKNLAFKVFKIRALQRLRYG